MKQILLAFARNSVLANILLALVLTAGLMAVHSMQRELFPDFSMDEVMIQVPYPGASPEEVEEGVTRKIEEALEGMEGIAQYATRSEEDMGSAEITVRHGVDPAGLLDRVRSRISAVSTFPGGAEKPMVTEVMHRTEVMKLYVSADAAGHHLKEVGRRIRDRLRHLDGVSQVELTGTRDYEIQVEIPEARLRAFGLSFEEVAQAISQSSLNLSGGTIRGPSRDIRIRVPAQKYTGRDLAGVAVRTLPDGSILTLDRLARITDGFTDDAMAVTVDGRPAVLLEIYKTRMEDALDISRAVTGALASEKARLPRNFSLGVLYDLTEDLRSRINLMVKNGIMGLCLVLLLLWLFLDFRLGFWSGMGIPVSILGALVVVWAMGGTINMLSLFGLITVLGIVVDDAIVVGEAVYHHFQKGLSPLDAALAGIGEVGMPVGAAILTTILAFLPLAFIGDIIGKFLSILPAVVIPCLIISLVECLFLLPAHLAHGLKRAPAGTQGPALAAGLHHRTRQGLDRFARKIYLPLLKKALAHRYPCLCGAVCMLCLCLGLVLGGVVRFEVLPDSGSALLSASVKLTPGTSSHLTTQAVARMENALLAAARSLQGESGPLLKARMAVVGSTVNGDADDRETGPNVGGVQVQVDAAAFSETSVKALLHTWENITGVIPGAQALTFEVQSQGPPGEDVEIWVQGPDPGQVRSAALECMAELTAIRGLSQVRSDASFGRDELRFTLKPEARFLGLTHQALARQIRDAFYGNEALRIQRGRDDLRIKVRYTQAERSRMATLANMRIRTSDGYHVPLATVADISFAKSTDVINRVDGQRCIMVVAAVDEARVDADALIDRLEEGFIQKLGRKYPDLAISFEGDEKHMNDALGGLFYGFPLAVLGIYTVVAAMFRSYSQPIVVLLAIPFGMVGAVLGHLVMGCTLSLMSIFGMVALSGIVVNDAIMLVQRLNENLSAGLPFDRALQEAGHRRFRAIILTTMSTVGGLAPLILETDLQAELLIPMAISISAGIVGATLLTLVLLPCALTVLSDLRLAFHRVRTGKKPQREILEPVIKRSFHPVPATAAAMELKN